MRVDVAQQEIVFGDADSQVYELVQMEGEGDEVAIPPDVINVSNAKDMGHVFFARLPARQIDFGPVFDAPFFVTALESFGGFRRNIGSKAVTPSVVPLFRIASLFDEALPGTVHGNASQQLALLAHEGDSSMRL